ncbi:inactive LRR receptor-like serine/threonine-protein kinase BIR2 [Camellia sinensis]|nr:inactive LRR receptor-like serine/threonine-protein kinase BIR2 [Camellia sinensis]XP_028119184.1 inactive LRR receptor-like serine/threonine-protein kinase BIR2 [Camellia sinensis]XP_028119185.1 inactive LRR receptor-like serine/threonine-protein kinase BIR2 [Camellia sinensis]
MNMEVNNRALNVLFGGFIWLLLSCSSSYGLQSDIDCLKSLKGSLEDPFNYLSSWNFDNATEGFICKFTGIDCWHPDENRVLNIRLSDMALKGGFPLGLQNCTALTGLDLSSNKLYGTIPSNISNITKFVTSFDLSSNNFSGGIPKDLANCTYLNIIKLGSNQLTGQIPLSLACFLGSKRIKTFNVANNLLSGPVPRFLNARISADSYANNSGLCGTPLPKCQTT